MAAKSARSAKNTVKVKNVREAPEGADGFRVLVDRIWPRGVSKQDADLGEWLKAVAPSTPLRRWFGHDPEKFPEFAQRYRAELRDDDAAREGLEQLRRIVAEHGVVTLVFGAKDREHNQAVVLAEVLGS